jgi:hypothetical protein
MVPGKWVMGLAASYSSSLKTTSRESSPSFHTPTWYLSDSVTDSIEGWRRYPKTAKPTEQRHSSKNRFFVARFFLDLILSVPFQYINPFSGAVKAWRLYQLSRDYSNLTDCAIPLYIGTYTAFTFDKRGIRGNKRHKIPTIAHRLKRLAIAVFEKYTKWNLTGRGWLNFYPTDR